MAVRGSLNDNHQSGAVPAVLALRSNSNVDRKPTARADAEKCVNWSAMRAHIVGITAIHKRWGLIFDLFKHSNPKRQPPKNDNIRAAYNNDIFSKKAFKTGLIMDSFKVDITPSTNGARPRVEINFTVFGILFIRLCHAKVWVP